jgi:hypothetical protein
MAKPVPLDDMKLPDRPAATTPRTTMRGRGVTSSADLVPMQFRMPPDFVHDFKIDAALHRMKLNEFFEYCYREEMKRNPRQTQ